MIAGYIRGSTAGQKITIESQEEKLKAFARLQEFDSLKLYTDKATTSHIKFSQRDAGSQIASGIDSGEITGLIMLKLDRAFRNTQEMLETIDIWAKNNIAVYVLDFGGSILDTTSATGRFFLTIRAAMDELERTQISERTKIALSHLKSQKRLVCNPKRIPFGYAIDSGVPGRGDCLLREIKEEQDIIKDIIRLRDGGLTAKEIGKMYREKNIPRRSGKWYTNHIKKILNNHG